MRELLQKLRRMNPVLFVAMILLVAAGTAFICSAGSARQSDVLRSAYVSHGLTALAGLVVYFALALWDYRRLLRYCAAPVFAVSLAMLVIVLLVGSTMYGGRRWLWFFQPSEIAKFAVVVALAALFGVRGERDEGRAGVPGQRLLGPRGLLAGLAIVGVPALLVLAEPDLGTALVMIPTGLAMLFAARVWNRGLTALVLAAAVGAAFVLGTVAAAERAPTPERRAELLAQTRLKPHQIKRLQVFLNPDADIHGAGYNLRQARISVGSGGLWGRGWKKGEQYRLGYLPQSVSMNDFIFAVLAEETGFAGTVLVLVLYGGLLFAGLWIGLNCGDDRGRLLAVGVTTLVFCHVYVNMAMSIGLMPITGLPLPFISLGRTFLVVLMALLGVLQSVSVHRAAAENDNWSR